MSRSRLLAFGLGVARAAGEPAVVGPITGAACLAARVDVLAEPPPPKAIATLGSVVFARDFLVETEAGTIVRVPRVELVVEGGDDAELVDVEAWPAELAPLAARAPLGSRARGREVRIGEGARVELSAEALVPLPPSRGGATHVARSPRVRITA